MAQKRAIPSKFPKAVQQRRTQPPALTQFTNFIKTTAGLEKTIRLIQALSQIAAETSSHNVTAARWATAKGQLAFSELPVL